MKKFSFITLSVVSLLALISCGPKEYDITMTNVDDGNLRIRMVNESDAGIPGVLVSLGYSSILEEKETDADGWVFFNDILSGNYNVYAEDITVNGLEYNVSQYVQVLAGVDKEYIIHPADYSGSVIITVYDDLSYEPMANVNVGVFRSDDVQIGYDFEDILDICIQTGVTNTSGVVAFNDLPFDNYGVLVYIDEDDNDWSTSAFYIDERGEVVETYFIFSIF